MIRGARSVSRNDPLARRQRPEQSREPDRAGHGSMSLSSWLIAAAFVLLMLVDCAAGQGPPPPAASPHDNGSDIRSM